MMKKIKQMVLIFLLNITFLQAQTTHEIKKGNTFFILFEAGDFAKKKVISLPDKPIKYEFYVKEKNSGRKTKLPYSFLNASYFNTDDQHKEKTRIYRVHKSFLRKNKKIILTREEMIAIGTTSMVNLFEYNKRNLFIIDKSEIEDNYIWIKEVRFMSMNYE